MVACPFWHHTLGFLETLQARLAEVFLLGNDTERVDLLLDIARNELPVSTHASCQIGEVVGVADGAYALGDLLALSGEAVLLLASRFHVLCDLRQACCPLWGAARAARCRLIVGAVALLLHPLERRCRLWSGLFGSPLCGGHPRRDRCAQFMLPMEEVRRVMRPKVMFNVRQKSRGFIAGRLNHLNS